MHLVRDPKALKFTFFIKFDHRSLTMGKDHLTWDNFVVHDVKQPLSMRR